jgi:hypothetical protein
VPTWMIGDYVGTGEEVDDPFGRDLSVYRQCAWQIARLVAAAVDRVEAERGQ